MQTRRRIAPNYLIETDTNTCSWQVHDGVNKGLRSWRRDGLSFSTEEKDRFTIKSLIRSYKDRSHSHETGIDFVHARRG
jgi:hypothetical protein